MPRRVVTSIYTRTFYEGNLEESLSSAEQIVPLVLKLMEPGQPASVIDVGCGTGAWLSVFRQNGITDLLGMDGAWVPRRSLLIPAECYREVDLENPPALERSFDLAVSMEVAEHLSREHADAFVAALVGYAPIVLFSAAIPFQGGTSHLNEQWPCFWAHRFKERGYVAVDCIRTAVWMNERVKWWYTQNMLLYVDERWLPLYPLLAEAYVGQKGAAPLPLVHPGCYLNAVQRRPLRNTIYAAMRAMGLVRVLHRPVRKDPGRPWSMEDPN